METEAVVLAAGEGKRMRPVSDTVPKELIPILGRPFIHYVLARLAEAEVRDIVIVSSEWKLPMIKELGTQGLDIRLSYAVQREPLGPAHALLQAKQFLRGESMLVYYGDNVAEDNVPLQVARSMREAEGVDSVIALRRVEDTSRYGIARFDGDRIVEIVEKPRVGTEPSRMAAMGVYAMRTESFFRSVRGVTFEYGKEQFPPQYVLKAGGRAKGLNYPGNWVDMGKPVDMLRASALLARERVSCLVLDADTTLFAQGDGGRVGGPRLVPELARAINAFASSNALEELFVAAESRAEAAQAVLRAAGLHVDVLRAPLGPNRYGELARRYRPAQVLVVGGDYARDLLGPARLGMHVLLVTQPEDLRFLASVTFGDKG